MEFRGNGFEVSVLCELSLGLNELSLCLRLEVYFGRAERGLLVDEVVFVDSFWIRNDVPYWWVNWCFVSNFSIFLTFLAKYSGFGLL